MFLAVLGTWLQFFLSQSLEKSFQKLTFLVAQKIADTTSRKHMFEENGWSRHHRIIEYNIPRNSLRRTPNNSQKFPPFPSRHKSQTPGTPTASTCDSRIPGSGWNRKSLGKKLRRFTYPTNPILTFHKKQGQAPNGIHKLPLLYGCLVGIHSGMNPQLYETKQFGPGVGISHLKLLCCKRVKFPHPHTPVM